MGKCFSKPGEGAPSQNVFDEKLHGKIGRDPLKDFTLGKKLGEGVSGETFAATNKKDATEKVALKKIPKATLEEDEARQMVISEVWMLREMGVHPNIVRLHSVYEDNSHVYIAMELLSGGELLEKITTRGQQKKDFTERSCRAIVRVVLQIVDFMHCQKVCHRDLKLENFVFVDDRWIEDGGTLKAIDFGMAAKVGSPEFQGLAGTYRYMAPEIVNDRSYDEKVDLWSVGAIMYCILAGEFPQFKVSRKGGIVNIDIKDEEDIKELTVQSAVFLDPGRWKDFSNECKDLLNKLLEADPKKRLSASAALNHPWIQKEGVAKGVNIDGMWEGKSLMQRMEKMKNAKRFKQKALLLLGMSTDDGKKKELQKIFDSVDNDKSGTISPEELQEALLKSGSRPKSKQELELFMEAIDVNKDGKIDFDEFVAAHLQDQVLENDPELLWSVFQKFDVDGTGYIEVEEIQEALKIDRAKAQEMLNEMDANGDGKVSYEEFVMMMGCHDKELQARMVKKASIHFAQHPGVSLTDTKQGQSDRV